MNEIELTPDQRQILEQLARSATNQHLRHRAQAILAYSTGKITHQVATDVGISRGRARYWKLQFRLNGMDIFHQVERQDEVARSAPQEMITFTTERTQGTDEELIQPPESEPGAEIPLPGPQACAGLLPDDTLAEAGRKVMLYQFAEMLRNEPGTRQGDIIEALHDMRVATRRLRAAFAVFGESFQPQILKPLLKGLRATGRALGAVRDIDVFIEKAQGYIAMQPVTNHPDLAPLLQAWTEERTAARMKMLTHLDSPKYQKFIQRFNVFVQTPGLGVQEISRDKLVTTRIRDVIPALIYSRLEAVRAYESVLDTASIAQLHALRIEFKRLRYAVEFFREVLGPEAKEVINELKTLQDHLGDLHDSDVACQLISTFLQDFETRQSMLPLLQRKSPESIVGYLSFQATERHRLLVTFPEAWQRFNRPEFRKNIALAIAAL